MSTIPETSEPMLYHLYHHQRLRQEAEAEKKASKKSKKSAPPKPWHVSRDKPFVGPTYQEEFIRRRLIELEDRLEKLSCDKDFAGVWDREVVEPLREWTGMNDEVKRDHKAAGVVTEGFGRVECMAGQELQIVEYEDAGGESDDIDYESTSAENEDDDDNEDAEEGDLTMRDVSDDEGGAVQGPGPATAAKAGSNCLKCKKDKKGCDKALPACGRCSEKGHACVYPEE